MDNPRDPRAASLWLAWRSREASAMERAAWIVLPLLLPALLFAYAETLLSTRLTTTYETGQTRLTSTLDACDCSSPSSCSLS